MSNLNEDDIAEYQEKTKNYGLYEVEQVEILGYENGTIYMVGSIQ